MTVRAAISIAIEAYFWSFEPWDSNTGRNWKTRCSNAVSVPSTIGEGSKPLAGDDCIGTLTKAIAEAPAATARAVDAPMTAALARRRFVPRRRRLSIPLG